MKPAIAIVALGAANRRSIACALERAGGTPGFVDDPAGIAAADAIVLPGVANVGYLIRALDRQSLRAPLLAAIARGIPCLGICAGYHLLFDGSNEAPGEAGLGVFSGTVAHLEHEKLPHMGWNLVEPRLVSQSSFDKLASFDKLRMTGGEASTITPGGTPPSVTSNSGTPSIRTNGGTSSVMVSLSNHDRAITDSITTDQSNSGTPRVRKNSGTRSIRTNGGTSSVMVSLSNHDGDCTDPCVIGEGWAYFAHSYAPAADVPDAVAVTEYGGAFASAAARGRVGGVQFHPERSGHYGVMLLQRFVAEARLCHAR